VRFGGNYLNNSGVSSLKKWVGRVGLAVGLVGIVVGLLSVGVQAFEFVGDSISVRTVGGTSGEILVVGEEGAADSSLLVGMGLGVETLSPTDVYPGMGSTKATLRGQVTSMGGLPEGKVYFQWGYSEDNLSNSTSIQTVTGTGTYTAGIEGYDPNKIVYYRIVGEGDGILYGDVEGFQVGGGVATAYRVTIVLVFIWIGLVILAVWGLTSLGLPLVVAVIFGAIIAQLGAIGVRIILESLLQWW